MYVTTSQLLGFGVTETDIEAKLARGEWRPGEPGGHGGGVKEQTLLVASLPGELQVRWMRAHAPTASAEQIAILLSEAAEHGLEGQEADVVKLLLHLPQAERPVWMTEAVRLARLVERYAMIKPKRRRRLADRQWEFVEGVMELCREAPCRDLLILARQPHRALVPSPHTLDGWLRSYRRDGLVTFLRGVAKSPPAPDSRRAALSAAAAEWINSNWRRFHVSRHLYRALKAEALRQGWMELALPAVAEDAGGRPCRSPRGSERLRVAARPLRAAGLHRPPSFAATTASATSRSRCPTGRSRARG